MRLTKLIVLVLVFLILSLQATARQEQDEIDFESLVPGSTSSQNYELIEEYNQWALRHAKRAFLWSHISSILIFFIVLIVIGCGLYFSYLQFSLALRRPQQIENSTTNMKIGKDGIEISSSIIGLLILMISVVFFYLYLRYVYPITLVNSPLTSPLAEEEN